MQIQGELMVNPLSNDTIVQRDMRNVFPAVELMQASKMTHGVISLF